MTLQTLPYELVIKISEYLPLFDLGNFQDSCRIASSAVNYSIAKIRQVFISEMFPKSVSMTLTNRRRGFKYWTENRLVNVHKVTLDLWKKTCGPTHSPDRKECHLINVEWMNWKNFGIGENRAEYDYIRPLLAVDTLSVGFNVQKIAKSKEINYNIRNDEQFYDGNLIFARAMENVAPTFDEIIDWLKFVPSLRTLIIRPKFQLCISRDEYLSLENLGNFLETLELSNVIIGMNHFQLMTTGWSMNFPKLRSLEVSNVRAHDLSRGGVGSPCDGVFTDRVASIAGDSIDSKPKSFRRLERVTISRGKGFAGPRFDNCYLQVISHNVSTLSHISFEVESYQFHTCWSLLENCLEAPNLQFLELKSLGLGVIKQVDYSYWETNHRLLDIQNSFKATELKFLKLYNFVINAKLISFILNSCPKIVDFTLSRCPNFPSDFEARFSKAKHERTLKRNISS